MNALTEEEKTFLNIASEGSIPENVVKAGIKSGVIHERRGGYRCQVCRWPLTNDPYRNLLVFTIYENEVQPDSSWTNFIYGSKRFLARDDYAKIVDAGIEAGVIRRDGDEYLCMVCMWPLGNRPHEKYKEHTDRYICFNPDTFASKALNYFIGDDERIKTKTVGAFCRIGLIEKEGNDYFCRVCECSLGQDSLEHIQGDHHNRTVFSLFNRLSPEEAQPSQPTGITVTHIKTGIAGERAGFRFRCNICRTFTINGKEGLWHHLCQPPHRKMAVACEMPLQDLPRYCEVEAEGPQADNLSGSPANAVSKNFSPYDSSSGEASLANLLLPNELGKSVGMNNSSHIPSDPTSSINSSQMATNNHPNPVDLSESVCASNFFSPSTEMKDDLHHYNLPEGSKGLVVVFNYIFRNQPGPWFRKGAPFDGPRIELIFTNLGFQVKVFEDLTKQATFRQLEEIATCELQEKGAFLLFFLSHGDRDRRENYFHTVDHKTISVQEIRRFLTDSRCPAMIGKPKIIFFNFCRGVAAQTNREIYVDSLSFEEIPKDFAIVQAAQPGIMAVRTDQGTVFVSSLCDILEQHATSKELKQIVNLTSDLMERSQGTTASVEFIQFRKDFYFF